MISALCRLIDLERLNADQARRGAMRVSCGVPGGVWSGDGAGTNNSASLCISSPSLPGRATDSARERYRRREEGSDDRTGPTISTTKEPSRNKLDVLTSDLPKKSRTTVRYTSKLFLDKFQTRT